MDLDELLGSAAPATATRSATLARELEALVVAAEAAAKPVRRRHRIGMVSAVTLGVLGVGSAGAMAAGLVSTPPWVPWSTQTGSQCHMQFWVTAAGPDGEPLSRPYTAAEKQRGVSAAKDFLRTFDFTSINKAQAIRAWQRAEDAAIANEPPGERQPRLHGNDLEITAVGHEVWDKLRAHLDQEGIPFEVVVPSQAWKCAR